MDGTECIEKLLHLDYQSKRFERTQLHIFLHLQLTAIRFFVYCSTLSQSTVVLCIGLTRSWPIMPVHSKIQIYTFTFSGNPLLTQKDDSQGQYVWVPKLWLELDH